MDSSSSSNGTDSKLPQAPASLLEALDTAGFEHEIDELVRRRQAHLLQAMDRIAKGLHEAASQLVVEARPQGHEQASAHSVRRDLQEAMAISESAAHAHLDILQRLLPATHNIETQARKWVEYHAREPADEALAAAADLAVAVIAHADNTCNGLTELLQAQSWQDLTGQRMQRIADFIDRAYGALSGLVELTGISTQPEAANQDAAAAAVPTSLASQDQVDQLLEDYGF